MHLGNNEGKSTKTSDYYAELTHAKQLNTTGLSGMITKAAAS
jgi:hypothetical protein